MREGDAAEDGRSPAHMACVFCRTLKNGDAQWVARADHAVAFLAPLDSALAPGHTIVATRAHGTGIVDATPVSVAALVGLIRRVSRSLSESLESEGVVVLHASGAAAGEAVEHLHCHVVPRWRDDRAVFWPSQRSAHVLTGGQPVHLRVAAAYRRLYLDRPDAGSPA